MKDEASSRYTTSREHTRAFLARERQQIEQLRADLGREVVDKLDRVLTRELLYERKERRLERLLGTCAVEPGHRYRVMVGMKGAKMQRAATARPPDRRARRKLMAQMQRAASLRLGRLEGHLAEHEVEVEQRFWINSTAVAAMTSEQVAGVAARGDVETLLAPKMQPVDCLDGSRPLIAADVVENTLGFDGSDIDVAVIDTGVDAAHPALAGVVVSQQDFTGEGIGDLMGHGTHCAGIIASQDGTRRGVAPGALIWDFKIIDQFGDSDPTWATGAIQAAVAAGVDVASNSWGWSHANGAWVDPDGTCVLCTAAANAVEAGVVFVVAAGNEDNDTCSTYDTHIRCPGMAPGDVITVGGSDDSDNMYNNSSIGPTPDGRTKPDVVAPGVDIGSARAAGTSMGSPIDANWTNATGTSMACPHVAGLAALMLHKDNSITPGTVKSILMSTAVDIGATPNEMGTGRVDARAAVDAV